MKYVIIGNSTAAIGCIGGIRGIDKEGEITVVSSEKYHTYSRPLISYLLLGKTDLNKIKYRKDTFYDDNNCKTVFGMRVEEICPDKKEIKLSDASVINYDKLLVAAGSNPIIPPIPGIEKVKNKFTFMSLDDALKIEKCITENSRVLIVGAGLIGLKCAEGIVKRVKSVTVVDLADRVLPNVLTGEPADIVRKHLERMGMNFILQDSVDRLDESRATLKGGMEIAFDILIVAVGVRANTELVKNAGGLVNRGIVIDSYSKTSLDDIYAAGDCTESFDITTEQYRVMALLPNAYLAGEIAGINMAGGNASFDNAIPMNATGFSSLHLVSAGSYDGEGYIKNDGENYKALYYKNNLLIGFILIGDVSRAGIYTSMIRNRISLDRINFDLLKDKPQLMAFEKNMRALLLGKEQ